MQKEKKRQRSKHTGRQSQSNMANCLRLFARVAKALTLEECYVLAAHIETHKPDAPLSPDVEAIINKITADKTATALLNEITNLG